MKLVTGLSPFTLKRASCSFLKQLIVLVSKLFHGRPSPLPYALPASQVVVDAAEPEAPPTLNRGALLYCERSLELLTDLLTTPFAIPPTLTPAPPGLYKQVVVDAAEPEAPPTLNRGTLLYCERSLELHMDLVTPLYTPFVTPLTLTTLPTCPPFRASRWSWMQLSPSPPQPSTAAHSSTASAL